MLGAAVEGAFVGAGALVVGSGARSVRVPLLLHAVIATTTATTSRPDGRRQSPPRVSSSLDSATTAATRHHRDCEIACSRCCHRNRGRVVAVAVTGCSAGRKATEDVAEHEISGSFYKAPDPLPPGAPGSLIKHERLLGAPNGAIAWRVMYHSRDDDDQDIAVTGVVVAPNFKTAPANRPVVVWAHPTTGSAPKCAPSAALDPFLTIEG